MSKASLCASALVAAMVSVAAGQSVYTPLAFGPLGSTSPGTFYTSTTDISADGRSVLAVLNTGAQRFITPGTTYTLTGTGAASELAADGQTLVGGQAGANPQRWRLGAAVGSNIASENFPWPGGPIAFGGAIGTNGNGTVAALTSPGVSVVGPFGRITAQSVFTAIDIGASAGAYRGMAASAPVMGILGSIPGNPTNAYRWNYSTGTLSPLALPAGASSMGITTGGSALSADASIVAGAATFGINTLPYWWDAAGVGHAVPLLPTSTLANTTCVNGSGTLVGGGAFFPLSVRHAYILSVADQRVYDLHVVASAAGLVPTGWTLTQTQCISDDGSRIFCLATAADGSTRAIVLDGTYNVPGPGAAALLGLGGLVASRRRRA